MEKYESEIIMKKMCLMIHLLVIDSCTHSTSLTGENL